MRTGKTLGIPVSKKGTIGSLGIPGDPQGIRGPIRQFWLVLALFGVPRPDSYRIRNYRLSLDGSLMRKRKREFPGLNRIERSGLMFEGHDMLLS